MAEPEHTTQVAKLVEDALDNQVAIPELNPFEQKRIKDLAPTALNWMKNLILEARLKRNETIGPKLRQEKRRDEWEKQRVIYLKKLSEIERSGANIGDFALAKKAKDELETLQADSKKFQQFVQNCLMTEAEPDIRVLAIFLAAE